jgi:hypothetical protein
MNVDQERRPIPPHWGKPRPTNRAERRAADRDKRKRGRPYKVGSPQAWKEFK